MEIWRDHKQKSYDLIKEISFENKIKTNRPKLLVLRTCQTKYSELRKFKFKKKPKNIFDNFYSMVPKNTYRQ